MNQLVRSDGAKLAWWSCGQGPAVLLVMGLGARGMAWRRQIEGLAAHHHLAWFDHRGVGASDPVTGKVTMATLAADAVAVADAAAMARFHVVGVSMGGMVAQHVALGYRDRVASLTLIATHPGGLRYRVPPLGAFRIGPHTRSRDPDKRADALARLLFPAAHLASTDRQALRLALREDFGAHLPLRTFLAQLGAVQGHDTRARLAELGGLPTLVIRPGHDNLVRQRGSDELAHRIPGAQLVRIDEAGHGVVRQSAAQVNRLLQELFARAGGASVVSPLQPG